MGRIANDLELRHTPNGVAVLSFRVAVARPCKKGEDGRTDFIDCTAWRNTAEFLASYFSKGSPVVLEGRLRVDSYEAKDGGKRRRVEVQVEHAAFCLRESTTQNGESGDDGFRVIEDSGDDLPF